MCVIHNAASCETANAAASQKAHVLQTNSSEQQPMDITNQDVAQPQRTTQAVRASLQQPQAAGNAPWPQQGAPHQAQATCEQSEALPEASAAPGPLPQVTQQMGNIDAEGVVGGVQPATAMLEEARSTNAAYKHS